MRKRALWVIEWKPGARWEIDPGAPTYTNGLDAKQHAEACNHNNVWEAYRATLYVPSKP